MTKREFARIGKELMAHLPGFAANQNVVFMIPFEEVLRGVYFFSSVDPDIFYFLVFFLPLYVPHDSVGPHAKRLRINGHERWSAADPNLNTNLTNAIHRDAIPFLNSLPTLERVANYLETDIDSSRPRVNSRLLEALAYTLIKCGDRSRAVGLLTEIQRRLDTSTVAWDIEVRKRARLIEEKLLRDPKEALMQLDAWKAETVSKLGLEKYWSPAPQ